MKKSLIILSLMGLSATQANATIERTYEAPTSIGNNSFNNSDSFSNFEDIMLQLEIDENDRAEYRQSSNDLNNLMSSRVQSQPDTLSFGTSANTPYSSNRLDSSAPPAIAASLASQRAHSRTRGLCARYVRQALQSAGYEFTPNPSAYQYATRGTLAKAGFVQIDNNLPPQVGDVVVFNRSARHVHGHIQIWDGNNWVSDFRQAKKNPYSTEHSYTTWRDARYLNDATNQGVYLAMGE